MGCFNGNNYYLLRKKNILINPRNVTVLYEMNLLNKYIDEHIKHKESLIERLLHSMSGG